MDTNSYNYNKSNYVHPLYGQSLAKDLPSLPDPSSLMGIDNDDGIAPFSLTKSFSPSPPFATGSATLLSTSPSPFNLYQINNSTTPNTNSYISSYSLTTKRIQEYVSTIHKDREEVYIDILLLLKYIHKYMYYYSCLNDLLHSL